MKPHNTTTIPEQFNRLPEPWRSKAIARCEAYYGKKLDEIDTIFHDLGGRPLSFLRSAFPWYDTPEGHAVWEAISARGEFPPSDTPATTYRQLINERLPEPFRTQALENTPDQVLEQVVRSQEDLEPGFQFVSSLFTWSDSPQGHDYWSRVRRGDLSSPSQDTPPAPTPEARLDILESRIAVLEGLVTKPEAPVCGDTSDGGGYPSPASAAAALTLRVGGKYRTRDGRTAVVERYENDGEWPFKGHVTPPTAGPDGGDDGFRSWRPDGSQAYDRARESCTDLVEEIVEEPAPPAPPHDEVTVDTSDGDGYPSTPPDPGPGYRLLQKGDPIIRGKAEAWHPDEGWYLSSMRGGDGDTFDPDTDYWFREPAPPVDPGPGYRLVEKGELIEEGDEWFECDGVWVPTKLGGSGARKNIDDPLRRRVGLVLAVGKTYKLRNGDTVTITGFEPETEWSWRGDLYDAPNWWRDDGSWAYFKGEQHPRDIVSELPPAYRLLNPGETILASDEVYLRGEWEEMAGDTGAGETFDPEEDHPIRRRIKSYEDA